LGHLIVLQGRARLCGVANPQWGHTQYPPGPLPGLSPIGFGLRHLPTLPLPRIILYPPTDHIAKFDNTKKSIITTINQTITPSPFVFDLIFNHHPK